MLQPKRYAQLTVVSVLNTLAITLDALTTLRIFLGVICLLAAVVLGFELARDQVKQL